MNALPSNERLQEITVMYSAHSAELHRLVGRRGSADATTVEDACSYAWTRLLVCEHVDLRPPRWRALAWLTKVAVHEAWRLNRVARRAGVFDDAAVDEMTVARNRAVPAAEDVADQHLRLDLVGQLPERPRRFLLRLAVGYSYDEIAVAEGVSYRTAGRQIARAKRILRELDEAASAEGGETQAPDA